MDEAEKYQQRLQAIAEKRRLQEEQDRVRRALEDEKIRLQQQKRKSLRDQWLMEGPPTSPDSAGPQSPLWGSKAQQIEAQIDKLQVETERLGDAVERLQNQIENSSNLTQSYTVCHGNTEGDTVLTAGYSEVRDISEKPSVTQNTPSLTNGTDGNEKPYKAPAQDGLTHTNGLAEGMVTLTFLGFSESEPGQGVSDDDSTIIRAERVVITDEGEESPKVFKQEETPESHEGDESTHVEEEEVEKKGADNHPEVSADDDHTAHATVIEGENKTTDSSTNANADATADANAYTNAHNTDTGGDAITDSSADANANNNTYAITVKNEDTSRDTSTKDPCLDVSAVLVIPAVGDCAAEGVLEEPTSYKVQLLSETIENAVEAPKQSGTECSVAVNPETIQQEGLNQTVSSSSSITPFPSSPSQFQDIPLDMTAEEAEPSRRPDGQLVEEPLLASKAVPLTDAASPNRAEGVDGLKRKTCQCCSIM